MTRTDPWELLGVAEGSSVDEIKAAFRAKAGDVTRGVLLLAMRCRDDIKNVHPDVYRGELDAEAITTRLVLAYELLLEEVENPTGGRRWRREEEEEEEEGDLWPWVNEIRCLGQSCRSSCIVTAPFLFSYVEDTARARAMSPDAFQGWTVGGETKDRARYCVNLAVGQCPELCIHYVTSAQHAELTENLQGIVDGVVPLQEGAFDIQSYIAKSTIVNIPGITSNGSTAALFHLILPQRYVIVLLTLVCSAVCYIERVGFSIAYTAIAIREGVDQATKGWVMSAFYYGYASSQVPGSWASQKYGGRRVLTYSFVAWSVLCVLTPTESPPDSTGSGPNTVTLVIIRLLVGIAQGFIFPAIHTVLAQWTPPHEKSRAVSLSMSGMYLGAGIAMQILPGLVASRGPESVFQLVAAMGVAWTILWVKYATDPPGGATAFAHVPVGGGMGGHKGSEAELLPLVNGDGERGRGGREEKEEDEEEEEEQQRLKRLGFAVNHMDIAPRFAGVVMGVSNTAGTMAGVVGVAASGLILEAFSGGEGSGGVGSGGVGGVGGAGGGGGGGGGIDPGWWWVFFTPASLCVVSALIFNAFATGERIFE
ncbi:unnamed protein product [Closterium sp. Naga37s-1]|nr:unnamed protein product [Closterium sp. Naga37s-1]